MVAQYRVRIKRGDFEIEVESTDKKYVEDRISKYGQDYGGAMLGGGRSGERSVVSGESGSRQSEGKRLSLQEFIKAVNPTKDTEYVLAVAYYCEKHEDCGELATKAIRERFRTIKYKHSNPADAVARAKKQAYLMPAGSKRSFVVTRSGEEWVEERLTSNEPA